MSRKDHPDDRPAPLLVAIVVLAVEGIGALGIAGLMATLTGALVGDLVPYVSLPMAATVAAGVPCLIAAWGA